MQPPPNWSGSMPRGKPQEQNQTKASPGKAKCFETFVARYYPPVYGFACRFTDDGREARVLTRDAFNTTQKQLQTCCDENVFASILISNVIRAGCRLNQTLRSLPKLTGGTTISGGGMVSRENRG